MTFILENESIKATFVTTGAEMTGLLKKDSHMEYIWHGDPAFWGRHAPILFPIVGRLKEDTYMYQNNQYFLSQHGFARDKEFILVEKTEQKIIFELREDEETLAKFPFSFSLKVIYELLSDGVTVSYIVENTGDEQLYFSIGAHPAFSIPLNKDLTFEDYYLHFSPQKEYLHLPLNGSYVDYDKRISEPINSDIQLKRALFKEDALIYETQGMTQITIRSDKSPESVTLSYKKMPFVGIWSPYPKEAPFVCIEPWYGIADTVNTSGQLSEKFGIQSLSSKEYFECQYSITVT